MTRRGYHRLGVRTTYGRARRDRKGIVVTVDHPGVTRQEAGAIIGRAVVSLERGDSLAIRVSE